MFIEHVVNAWNSRPNNVINLKFGVSEIIQQVPQPKNDC